MRSKKIPALSLSPVHLPSSHPSILSSLHHHRHQRDQRGGYEEHRGHPSARGFGGGSEHGGRLEYGRPSSASFDGRDGGRDGRDAHNRDRDRETMRDVRDRGMVRDGRGGDRGDREWDRRDGARDGARDDRRDDGRRGDDSRGDARGGGGEARERGGGLLGRYDPPGGGERAGLNRFDPMGGGGGGGRGGGGGGGLSEHRGPPARGFGGVSRPWGMVPPAHIDGGGGGLLGSTPHNGEGGSGGVDGPRPMLRGIPRGLLLASPAVHGRTPMQMPGGGGRGGGGGREVNANSGADYYKYDVPSFRTWMLSQTDDIGEEALLLYKKYKLGAMRTMACGVFDAHKHLQWFKDVYHPAHRVIDHTAHRKESIMARLAAFQELDDGRFDAVSLSGESDKNAIAQLILDMNAALDPNGEAAATPDFENDGKDNEGEATEEKKGGSDQKEEVAAAAEEDAPPAEKKRRLSSSSSSAAAAKEADEEELDFGDDAEPGELSDDDDAAGGAGSKAEAAASTSPEKAAAAAKTASAASGSKKPRWAAKPVDRAEKHIQFETLYFPAQLSTAALTAALKEIPGFKRLAIINPPRIPIRRATITFAANAEGSVAGVQSNLNKVSIRGFDMLGFKPSIARTVVCRVPGDTVYRAHPDDGKLVTDLIKMFDAAYGTWQGNGGDSDGDGDGAGTGTARTNPVLADGVSDDKRVLFLRVVYSFDFYSGVELWWENDMPTRMGYITARKDDKMLAEVPSKKHFRQHVVGRVEAQDEFPAEMLKEMTRTEEEAVAQFVKANSADDVHKKEKVVKCTLCEPNKKFKTIEFLQKHFSNKHEAEIKGAKQNAAFFNAYLVDPLRVRTRPYAGGSRRSTPNTRGRGRGGGRGSGLRRPVGAGAAGRGMGGGMGIGPGRGGGGGRGRGSGAFAVGGLISPPQFLPSNAGGVGGGGGHRRLSMPPR